MAPVVDEINAADADLDLRRDDGIALTDFLVKRINPTVVTFKWHFNDRSPAKRFTVWLRNVRTQEYNNVRATVLARTGHVQVDIRSLNLKNGQYQLVITKYNNYEVVYARSITFRIKNNQSQFK